MSHNKKRNTAFLFEVLSREATKSIINKDFERASFIKNVLIKYFGSSTELSKELQLYKLLENNSVESQYAEKYLWEAKIRYDKLDKKKIFNEQSSVINTINKYLGSKVYNTFIPNYKNLATIAQIFSDKTAVREKVLLENFVINSISKKQIEKEEQLKPIDNIVYKTFTNQFNQKYSNLLREQKDLLSRFVGSFADNGLELKIYLNEELGRLKEAISSVKQTDEIKNDKMVFDKTTQVEEFLKNFKDAKDITNDMLEKVLKIQQFVHEVNN